MRVLKINDTEFSDDHVPVILWLGGKSPKMVTPMFSNRNPPEKRSRWSRRPRTFFHNDLQVWPWKDRALRPPRNGSKTSPSENQSHQIQNSQKNSHDQFHYQVNLFPIHDQNLTFSETWWGQHRPRLFQIRRCSFAAVATVSWFTIHHLVMVETPGRFVRSEFPMAQLLKFFKICILNWILLPWKKTSTITCYHHLSWSYFWLIHPTLRPEGATMRSALKISSAEGHAGHPSVDAAIIQGEQGLHEFHFADSWRAIKREPKTQSQKLERRIVWCWNDPRSSPSSRSMTLVTIRPSWKSI